MKPHILLNGITDEDTENLQEDLRLLQQSSSMDEFTDRIEDISESEIWNNESLLQFRRYWFAQTEVPVQTTLIELIELVFQSKLVELIRTFVVRLVQLSKSKCSVYCSLNLCFS